MLSNVTLKIYKKLSTKYKLIVCRVLLILLQLIYNLSLHIREILYVNVCLQDMEIRGLCRQINPL
jgi:hypothetical protein